MSQRLNVIADWEQYTQRVADVFVNKYFGKNASDVYWIGEDIGGVMVINDYFFDLSDMIDFLRYNYSTDDMFEYYELRMDYELKKDNNPNTFMANIKNWKKLK